MLKTAVENVADGVMDAHEAVRDENAGYAIAAALTNVTLRDMSMIFITTQLAQSMGEIWREAAIVHRGSLRANALAVLPSQSSRLGWRTMRKQPSMRQRGSNRIIH